MTHATPEDDAARVTPDQGTRAAVLAAWVLFALTLPTAGLSAVLGVGLAYAMQSRAVGLDQAHIGAQIALFWSGVVWAALLTVAWWLSLLLTTIYVGIPFVFLFWAALLLLGVWFTLRSVLGVAARAGNREP